MTLPLTVPPRKGFVTFMNLPLETDHGVPIPVFRALEDHGPITLVHTDAHLDWRDEVNGAREGYSSPIRRAS